MWCSSEFEIAVVCEPGKGSGQIIFPLENRSEFEPVFCWDNGGPSQPAEYEQTSGGVLSDRAVTRRNSQPGGFSTTHSSINTIPPF